MGLDLAIYSAPGRGAEALGYGRGRYLGRVRQQRVPPDPPPPDPTPGDPPPPNSPASPDLDLAA